MSPIEGNRAAEVRPVEPRPVETTPPPRDSQTSASDAPSSASPEALQAQGELTRFQLEARYNQTPGSNGAPNPGDTPRAAEALRTVRTALDDSGLFDDVTHDELRQIDNTLRGLNRDELNHVLSQMSPDEMTKWGSELNSGAWFGMGGFDEEQQNGLFNHLAQNATPENLIRVFEGLGTNADSVSRLMDSVAQSAPPGVKDAFLRQVVNHPNMESIRNEMLLDLGQMGLDVAGIFDPTGVVDGANAIGYLLRGKIGDAIMTGVGIVPLLGDLAKAGKLGKFGRLLSNVVDMARHSPQFARAAETALGKLRDVFKSIPLDNLPAPIRDFVESTTRKLDDFFGARAARSLTDDLANAGYRSSDATRAQFRDMFVNTFGQARYDDYVRAAEQLKASNPQYANIPTDDLVALRGYTDDVVNPATGLRDYQAMNQALRGGDPAQLAQYDAYIRSATSALNQLPPNPGTVFRGANLPPDVLANYRVGETVTERAFTSTSSDPAQSFPGTQFVINSTSGRNVAGASAIPSESEILFRPGTQFEVLRVDVDAATGVRTIFMNEVTR